MAPGVLDALSVAQLIDEVEAEVMMNRKRTSSANTPPKGWTPPINSTPASETTPGAKRAATSELPQDNKRLKTAQILMSRENVEYVHPDRRSLLGSARPHSQNPTLGLTKGKDGATPEGQYTSQALPVRATPKLTSLHRAIRRQNDSSMDNQEYERLLHLRRNERTVGVDRYVPAAAVSASTRYLAPRGSPPIVYDASKISQTKSIKPVARTVGFSNLPEGVQDKILGIALVRPQSIKLDFSWLIKNFIQSHTKIPISHDTVTLENAWYTIPRSTTGVRTDIQSMHARLSQDCSVRDLLHHAHIYSRRLAPEGVNTALFHISREVHTRAARIFYSGNTFCFPSPEAGFMTLEAFLVTIGKTNASYLRSLRVHAPLWHTGVASDAIEGAMLDALSPATRLAVLKPPGEDRLLSAIETCTSVLAKASNLKTLQLDLLYPEPARHFISQSVQTNLGLVRQEDAVAFVERKRRGIELLKQASTSLTTTSSSKPAVRVLSVRPVSPPVAREFRFILTSIIREAEKYGWGVDQILRDPASWKWD